MFTLPNLISLMRIPLALLFLYENVGLRVVALLLAMISDSLDGFIARRFGKTSRVGTVMDPITDKFFVLFVLYILIIEGRLGIAEAIVMMSRDFAVILFGIYLVIARKMGQYQFRAIYCGKASTFLQFVTIFCLISGWVVPNYFYICFIVLGVLALGELCYSKNVPSQI